MEEADLQLDLSGRVTSSPEGGDINLDGVDHLLSAMASFDADFMLYGNNTLLFEGANTASSSRSFFASPSSPFLDPATHWEMPACTNTSLMEPNTSVMSSQLPLTGNNVYCEVANMALSSPSFLASSYPFFSDDAANWGMSACADNSLMYPNTSIMSSQPPLTGNNACREVANMASSSPSFFASPSPFFSDVAANWGMPACADTSLTYPNASVMPSQQPLLMGNNACREVANMASSSPSFLASPSPFFSDVAANWGMPPCTDTSLTYPNTSVMSSQQPLLTGNNACREVANMASSSSSSFLAYPSPFFSDVAANWGMPPCTDTSLMQPGIPAMSSQPFLLGNNMCVASSSPNFVDSPSVFPSDAEATTVVLATPSSANTCGTQTRGASSLGWLLQALAYIINTQREKTNIVLSYVMRHDDGQFKVMITGRPLTLDQGSGRLDDACHNILHPNYPGVCMSALVPVFEKGKYSCLGVIEFMTIQKHTFFSDVNAICDALKAVNLTTDASSSPPRKAVNLTTTTTQLSRISRTKFNGASYIDALPEILQVLRAACIIHNLPLAQTWATCAQQGKQCTRHSDENHQYCISTIEAACYVNDPRMQFFHEACSLHNLLPGQGVAGKAFTTNQRCFLPDIGSLSEQEYPLSHPAKISKLKGALAIRFRCTRTAMADFVLEFFLPMDCEVENEQQTAMDSLWVTVQSLSKTLRMVTNKEMQDDTLWEMNETNSLGLQKNNKVKKRKPMARRSPVWNSFTIVMVGDNVKAKCNHCDLELCCDSKTHGTSSLKKHSEICKLNPKRITGPI